MRLRVSDNHRFVVREDGAPFYYLGDTAWELFHRLTREEADFYLETRAAQRFTVIMAVVIAEHGGLQTPSAYGEFPVHDNDPDRPNEAYMQHVDYVVNKAESLGLTIGMLPTWGDKWNKAWGDGPEIFTPDNARRYGAFLAERYRDKPILWILGGDRTVETEAHYAIIRAMAAGIREADDDQHLITFHPQGQQTSSQYFHNDAWLDFNMYQTGHTRDRDAYRSVEEEYALTPPKPSMDAEPGYEDHPNSFKAENGYLDAYDVRKSAYWAVFAGAFGNTYGCHDIWQFYDGIRKPISVARTPWRTAINFDGANQMRFVRALLESRPFLTRLPDQSLLVSDALTGTDHIQATRGASGAYALVYSASGQPFTLDVSKLSGETLTATWYDPRTGTANRFDAIAKTGTPTFTPPTQGPGNDWVLVLDDAAQNFAPPGQR